MNKINKLLNIVFVLCLILPFFIPSYKVKAKTIAQMQKELDQKRAEYNKNQNKKNEINKNIDYSKSEITASQKAITQAEKDLDETGKKIQQLDSDIESKSNEINELMKTLQLADGDIAYLEYVFGASDMTDLIHRSSIIEEITEYNEKKITEMNEMVEKSKKLQVELKQKQENLQKKIAQLNSQISSYNASLASLDEIQVDVSKEMNQLQQTINYYKKICSNVNQDVDTCLKGSLPYDTSFWRPTDLGYISSEYSIRTAPCVGCSSIHLAVDIGGMNIRELNVYASAAGKVVGIENSNSNSCGGNYIIIQHNIKGSNYSTLYMHLKKVLVKVGQSVTKDTVIGIMGGNRYGSPGYTPWDRCSTGQHLHFGVSTGLQSSVSGMKSASFNPRSIVNFPSGQKRFYDRTTAY